MEIMPTIITTIGATRGVEVEEDRNVESKVRRWVFTVVRGMRWYQG